MVGRSFWRGWELAGEVVTVIKVPVEPRYLVLSHGHRSYEGAWHHTMRTHRRFVHGHSDVRPRRIVVNCLLTPLAPPMVFHSCTHRRRTY